MKSTKRVGGRPRLKPVHDGERVHLGFRVTPDLKSRLEMAAELNGRSQSQEAELRLERSLSSEQVLEEALDLAYGPAPAALVLTIAQVMSDAGRYAAFSATGSSGPADWLDDAAAFDQAAEAVTEVLRTFRAALGEFRAPRSNSLPDLGVGLARGYLEAIKNEDRGGAIGDWAKPIRKKLGAERSRRLPVADKEVLVPGIDPSTTGPAALVRLRKTETPNE